MRSDKPVSWDVAVPEGAQLFGVTSGVMAGKVHQFWVGWLLDRRLHAQALLQEAPIDSDLAPGESPIFPAVMDGSGRACLYSWRKGRQGSALWRHIFSGKIKSAGSATAEALSEVAADPLVSGAAAVPGEASRHAVLAWVEETPAGAVLGLAIVEADRLRVLRSDPIADAGPVVRQRIGVWAASFDRAEVAAVLEARQAPRAYSIVRFSSSPGSEKGAVSRSPLPLPPGMLHAAASDYYKVESRAAPQHTFLMTDGSLLSGKSPTVRRTGVTLDSPLPIVTTAERFYWGVRASDGTLAFEPL